MMPIRVENQEGLPINPDAAREAKNAYMRQWRARNRERDKANQLRYWSKVAERNRNGKPTENTRD